MKKILITLLQLTVTAGALWFIFKNPANRAAIAYAFGHAEPGWVLASIAASAFSPLAAGARWGLLMGVQGIHIGWKRVAQLYMIGNFFNLFLFGSTGGDAIKMYYLMREAGPNKRPNAILSVIMDRLLGLVGLILIAAIFVGLRYRWLTQTKDTATLLATFGLILGSAVAGLTAAFVVISLRLADRLPARLPGRAKLIDLAAACQTYARAWRTALLGIVISWVGHASFFLTYYCAARAVQSKVSLLDMSTVIPIINTIVALPISVSGVGLREALFKQLLGDLCGTPGDLAVAISAIGFLCSVIFYGLLGVVFFLFYRSATGAPPPPALEAMENALEGEPAAADAAPHTASRR